MEWRIGGVRMVWIRSPVTYASMVHSTWPSRAMWRMHAQEDGEEEEGDTPHVDTWQNARVWVDFLSGLHWWQISWLKGEKRDNKEWGLNDEHPFSRVWGYWRVCDIVEVDSTEIWVYLPPTLWFVYICVTTHYLIPCWHLVSPSCLHSIWAPRTCKV